MARSAEFRDFLYVSARKVTRMSRTLHPGPFKRLRDLQLSLGPVGATVKLDSDSRAEDTIALVPSVERAIDETYGIKYLSDPDLQVGHWFMVDGVPMSYGVPSYAVGGVLFAGEEGPVRFTLCGSAKYLLDRDGAEHPRPEWGFSPSGLAGLRRLLQEVTRHELEDNDSPEAPVLAHPTRGASYDFHSQVRRVLGNSVEPLSTLARCLHIQRTAQHSMIFGTPLYVAFHVPD